MMFFLEYLKEAYSILSLYISDIPESISVSLALYADDIVMLASVEGQHW